MRPAGSRLPIAGNSAVSQPRISPLLVELAVLVADLRDHYLDPERGFDSPQECALLDRVAALLERARREGVPV